MITRTCLADTFDATYDGLREQLLKAPAVNTGHWQSLKNVPHTHTRELQHVALEMRIRSTVQDWQEFMKPNLPWAEDHFQERVCGEPLNPGEQYKNWPWYRGGVEDHKKPGQFSHTYMERFWSRFAGNGNPEFPKIENFGIHSRYGDLNDLLILLAREPYTRQAYLPIWFPEDLAAASEHEERVPCTLGYHFMLREDHLHCFYPMRSVDFVRYLRDDIYMAGRLVQWIIGRLNGTILEHEQLYQESIEVGPWKHVQPGRLTFFASSLHIFEGDLPKLRREHEQTVA